MTQAISFHEQVLEVACEIGDRHTEGTVLGDLGRAYADLGEVNKAIGFYEKALVIARQIGDRRARQPFGQPGVAYSRLGEV